MMTSFPNTRFVERAIAAFVMAAALSIGFVGAAQAELPVVQDAFIPQPPPGAPVAAAFMVINNPHDEALVITGASSPGIDTVEIHRTEVVDDVARMRRQDELVIDAGASITLEHGGLHLMLMGLNGSLTEGDNVSLVLNTSAGDLPLEIPVMPRMGMSGSHDMKHGDKKHDGMKH